MIAPWHPGCRLSSRQAREIRQRYQPGVPGASLRDLGIAYGVSHVAIWKIVRGKQPSRETAYEARA